VQRTGLRQYIVKTLGLMISLGFTVVAGAAPQQRLSIAPKSKSLQKRHSLKRAEIDSGLSGSVGLSYSQSMVDYQDGSKKSSAGGSAELSGSITSNWTLSGEVGFAQNLRDPEDVENGVTDLSIGLSQNKRELASWLLGKWSISSSYPLSEVSVKVDNFQGSIGTRYRLILTSDVLAKGWDASFSIGANRNFYKYETDKEGTVLNPHSIRETFAFGYTYQRFSISVDATYAHRFSFEGNVSERLLHSEEIGFDIEPDVWSIAIGHTNRTSWFSKIDQDSNLRLIDEDSSKVYAQTEVSF